MNDKSFLFNEIVKATEDKDIDSIHKIIEMYMPLIIKYSLKSFSSEVDEDLRQTIILRLSERIPNFRINL